MNNKQEIIEVLNKVYSHSEDTHNIYTPLELCEEMINSLNDLNGDILVISNMEFLIVLKSKINLDKVHYTTSCDIKKQVAIQLGVNLNNIHNLEYNKEINLGTKDMKFDVIVMNPPYNPNSLWKKFTLKAIDTLKDDGQMVVIHPYGWRDSSTHKKLCDHLKEHISELHITDFNSFPGIGIKTDWYIYNKISQVNCKVVYSNNESEILQLQDKGMIVRLHTDSIENKIVSKILTSVDNGILFDKGFNDAYKNNSEFGKYKQCGGPKKGTKWITGDFLLTDDPTKHQFDDKIVISYAGKPRATYFNDNTGVCVANYWLTKNLISNPDSVCMVLNSNMFWKISRSLMDGENIIITRKIPAWILRSINLNNCFFTTEEEMYKHYGLTEEEINFCES